MAYSLQDLIDIPHFQSLQDKLNEIYSFPSAIIDNDGNVLTATAWQDICTKFHRVNPECREECIKSDKYILEHLKEANPAVSYKCPHGLIDNATPIIIDGVHYGNYFTGQFFLEEPDLDFFRSQAKKYGFDEAEYIDAVKRVPVWRKDQLTNYLYFIKGLIEVISSVGVKNLKEAEAKKTLEESEMKFRNFFENSAHGKLITGLDGKLLEMNKAFCEMLGYTKEELLNLNFADITHPDDIRKSNHNIDLHLSEKTDITKFEKRYIRKDGETVWVEVISTLQKDTGNNPQYFITSVNNITERKKAEKALAHSHDLMRYVIEHNRSAVAVHDKDLKYIYVSKRYLDDYKVKEKDIIGKHHYDVFPDLPQKWRDVHQKALKGIISSAEDDPYYKDDGTVEWTRWECRPWYETDGTIGGIIVYTEVITERKKIELKLKESEENFRLLLNSTAEGIYGLDMNGNCTFCNESALKFFGVNDEKDVLGRNMHNLIHHSHKDGTHYSEKECKVFQAINKGVKEHIDNEVFWRMDGSNFPVEYWAYPIYHEDSVIGSVVTFVDITERRASEMELEKHRNHLEELVKLRTEELDRINKNLKSEIKLKEAAETQLEEALKNEKDLNILKSRFISTASHEFRTPLTSILFSADLIKKYQDKWKKEKIEEHLERIINSVGYLTGLMDDILKISKAESGKLEIKIEQTDLYKLCSHMMEETQILLNENHKIEMFYEAPKNIYEIDPKQVELIIQNLLSNAIKYSPDGGKIEFRVSENRDNIIIEVKDEGIGIPEDDIHRIHEPFHRGRNTVDIRGTGLGLAIVKNSIDLYGGSIEVSSAEGKGSVFKVTLPLKSNYKC